MYLCYSKHRLSTMDAGISFLFSGDKTFHQSMEITGCTNVCTQKKKPTTP